MNKTRAIEGFVCIAVLIAVLFVGVWQIKPAYATYLWSDGFESKDFSAWTSTTGTPSVQNVTVHNETWAALIDTAGYSGEMVKHLLSVYQTDGYVRFYYMFNNTPATGEEVEFYYSERDDWNVGFYLKVQNDAGTEKLRLSFDGGTWTNATYNFIDDIWYCFEIRHLQNATAGGAEVWVNAVKVISDLDQAFDYSLRAFYIGSTSNTNFAVNMCLDDVILDSSPVGMEPYAPTAIFTVSHNPTLVNNTASFNATTSLAGWNGTAESPIVSWDWDFNDTHTDTGETVDHNFTQLGTYNVSLTVTDEQALNDTEYYSLVISQFEYLTVPHGTGAMQSETRGILMKYIFWYDHNDTLICETMNNSGFNAVYMEVNAFTYTGMQMAELNDMIVACRAYNLTFHVLLIMQGFNPSYTDEFEAGYGTGLTGNVADWEQKYLNGTGASNACLNRNSSRERVKAVVEYLVTNYTDICDINLDYIRYPDHSVCYCNECKADFQAWLITQGKSFTVWNDYAYGNVSWADYSEWRQTPINDMVRDVREWAYAIRTNVTISADVFTPYSGWTPDEWIDELGQDPAYWITHGYVDAICPMNYVETYAQLVQRTTNEQNYWLGGGNGAVPLIHFLSLGGPEMGYEAIPFSVWLDQINYIRNSSSNGFILWRYGGAGFNETGESFTDFEPYAEEMRANSTLGDFDSFSQTVPVLTGTTITWITSVETTSKVEYSLYPVFQGTNHTGSHSQTYLDIDYSIGTTITNSTPTTIHSITIPISKPFYYRVLDNDSKITLASPVYSSSESEIVTITITHPTNTTYMTPTISVQISASGGTIDTIWWNCKNGTSWIYGSNQTYTAPTSMTGFVNGASYTFYAWANNTLGEWDEETVMFTVEILYVSGDYGSWWGDWW